MSAFLYVKKLLKYRFILGEAALLILKNQFGDDWAKKIKVIFAGDDNTDEDAMRVIHVASY